MQERRILGYYIDKDIIPSSALELIPSMIYNKEPHNTYYIPLYGNNRAPGNFPFPYMSLNNSGSSVPYLYIYTTIGYTTSVYVLGNIYSNFVSFSLGQDYYVYFTDKLKFVSKNSTSNSNYPELTLTPLYVSSGNYYYASPITPNAYIKVQFKYPVYMTYPDVTSGIDVNSNGSMWTYPIYVDDEEVIGKSSAIDLGLPSGIRWSNSELPGYFEYGAGLYAYNQSGKLPSVYTGQESTLLLSKDPAHCFLKGKWRTPTKLDFEELMANTTVSYSNSSVTFTAANGNSILFSTTARYYSRGSSSYHDGGYYHTATREDGNPVYFRCTSSGGQFGQQSSWLIAPLRAVWDPNLTE